MNRRNNFRRAGYLPKVGKPAPLRIEGDTAYRGYLIRIGLLGNVFVERDGALIFQPASVDAARSAIDELVSDPTDPGPTP